MLGNIYNIEKVHRTNLLIIVLTCIVSFLQMLILKTYHNSLDLLIPFTAVLAATVVFLVKTRYSNIKSIIICIIPYLSMLYIFDQQGAFVNRQYILFISLIMATMYFDYKILIRYAIIQNILMTLLWFAKNHHLLNGTGYSISDYMSILIFFNIVTIILCSLVKWGRGLIEASSSNYLELSALYGEVAERDKVIKNKSNELTLKEEEIGSLYNQVAASEEELKSQYTTLEEKQEQIKRNEEIFRAISETCNDGIWYLDIKKGTKTYSENWCDLLGYTQADLLKMEDFHKLLHPEDIDVTYNAYKKHLNDKTKRYNCQYRIRNKQGEYIWVDEVGKVLCDQYGEPTLIVGANTDITRTREQKEKIEYLAYHDLLTGLPNRSLFYDRLKMSINERSRKNEKLALIIMDLDNFKMVNDSLGHSFGDDVLRSISDRLKSIVRESDTLARFGGDSFAMILNNIKEFSDVTKLADRVNKILDMPINIKGQEIDIRGSMGFAVYPEDGDNSEDLLKNADTALYKAKINGKNSYQFFNKTMKNDIVHKLEIEKKLRVAIKKEEFVLHFQPQIDILNKKIRGFEALIRWHYGKELIYPDKFISIAEETGLIVELGEWILMEACRKNKEWTNVYNSEVVISVNISVVQLKQRGFVQYVKNVLEVTGMRPECLELEITESMFIGSFEESVNKLNELRELGIKIALDDFGTGYSSLNYLQNLPIDTLKIDKTFIDGISNTDSGKEIVGAIIRLIQTFGLNTIAEGVETKEQLKYLTQNGCENVQGYIFSKPVPEADASRKLFEDYSKHLNLI